MSAPYAWIIDRDHIGDADDNDAGVSGPRSASDENVAKLKAGEGHPFRMKDDDGELYYEGRLIGDDESEQGFAPLDDFGMPNAGAVSIEYKNAAGGWEAL